MRTLQTICIIPVFLFIFVMPALNQEILKAVQEGNLEKVKELLEKDPELVNAQGENLWTPLFYAAGYGHIDIVKELISNGAKVNMQSTAGWSPLHFAAIRGHKEVVETLIVKNAHINIKNKMGQTPLHWALWDSQFEICDLLLNKGAEITAKDNYGKTPIQTAVEMGYLKIVMRMLKHENAVNDRNMHTGKTLLHIAAINGYKDIAEILINKNIDVNVKDNSGKSPLYYAAKYCHKETAELLIERGANEKDMKKNYGNSYPLKNKLDEEEAYIWYLGHSGWAVKTKSNLLIFDYYNYGEEPDDPSIANGHVNPYEIKNLEVFVFISHAHTDHFDKVILQWDKVIDNITYIFCWKAFDHNKYIYMDGYRDVKKTDNSEISKINSKFEPGGAFLVKVDGLVIYHGGDYSYKEDNDDGDMDYLAGKYGKTDIAFIEFGGGMGSPRVCNHTIAKLQPRIMFPMHHKFNEITYKEYAEKASKKFPRVDFQCAENKGDVFFYSYGEIK